MPNMQHIDPSKIEEILKEIGTIKGEVGIIKSVVRRKCIQGQEFIYTVIGLSCVIVGALFVGTYCSGIDNLKWNALWFLSLVFITWCVFILGLAQILTRRKDDF